MSNKQFDHLIPEFKSRVETLIGKCRDRNVVMWPLEGIRNPIVQARYWRQSRSDEEVDNMLRSLEKEGAHFLAGCIAMVGPQTGNRLTNAIPGLSWHQWGEALDCVWLVDNKAVWDVERTIDNVNGYRVYAEEARALGLDAGLFWPRFVDAVHVQLRPAASPRELFSLEYINQFMEQCYGTLVHNFKQKNHQ
nr:M15 family metallopeptidase [uncultured Chitinophaga sp.]